MRKLSALFTILPFWPALLLAEGGEAHHASFSDLIVFWLNFIVYALLLYFLLRKPFPILWLKRRAAIQQAVQSSAAELDRAKTQLDQSQKKLAGIEADISRLHEEVRHETIAEQKALEEYAQAKSQKIFDRARDNYNAETRALEQKLQHEISELALKLVRDKFASEISPEIDRVWREAALKNIKGLVN